MADEEFRASLKDFTPPEVLKKYLPTGFHGNDKDGCPIKIDNVGNMDLQGLLKSVKAEDIIATKALQGFEAVELCKEQSEKLGKEITSNTVIYDMDGLGMHHLYRPGLKMMSQVANMFQEKFPGLTKQVIIVNAPRIFPVIYSIVAPLVRKEMRERVKVFGSNWKEELSKLIDPDQLPQHYGGTCDKHGGPKCKEVVSYGGTIPDEYHSLKNVDKSEYEVATVKPGAILGVDVHISIPKSIIKWNFVTDVYDIGFSIHYVPTDAADSSEKTVLSPMTKIASNFVLEEGELLCEKTGMYTISFDNSYSWIHSKKLYYLITVVNPEAGTDSSPVSE